VVEEVVSHVETFRKLHTQEETPEESIVEFATMANGYYGYGPLLIIDPVTNTPIANTDAPQALTNFYFEAPVRARIVCKTEGSGNETVLR
jgi:hypothetical protein